MTRHDTLKCVHEPFGDAYYFGPERLAERYENDEESRTQSGFQNTTYNTVMDRINRENTEVGLLPSMQDLNIQHSFLHRVKWHIKLPIYPPLHPISICYALAPV